MEGINKVLDRYGLSREEFWKDPEAFINNLEDKDAKAYIGVLHANSITNNN